MPKTCFTPGQAGAPRWLCIRIGRAVEWVVRQEYCFNPGGCDEFVLDGTGVDFFDENFAGSGTTRCRFLSGYLVAHHPTLDESFISGSCEVKKKPVDPGDDENERIAIPDIITLSWHLMELNPRDTLPKRPPPSLEDLALRGFPWVRSGRDVPARGKIGSMRDTELYHHLLGLEAPWKVERVELSAEEGRVDVWVVHPGGTRFACSDCAHELSVYDHAEERAWRHLDSCAFLTFLHASPPRVKCPEHGVSQVRLPWAEPHSRFTTLFERLAIDVLAACDVAAAARLLRISWDQAWHLMERAVARGLATKPLAVPAHVGVDEKAAGKGQDYITVVSDLDAGTVDYIADERRQASLDGYFEKFTPEQREQIQAVAMDMWEPFAASVRAYLSEAPRR